MNPGWSRYLNTNRIPTSPPSDDLATAPPRPVSCSMEYRRYHHNAIHSTSPVGRHGDILNTSVHATLIPSHAGNYVLFKSRLNIEESGSTRSPDVITLSLGSTQLHTKYNDIRLLSTMTFVC